MFPFKTFFLFFSLFFFSIHSAMALFFYPFLQGGNFLSTASSHLFFTLNALPGTDMQFESPTTPASIGTNQSLLLQLGRFRADGKYQNMPSPSLFQIQNKAGDALVNLSVINGNAPIGSSLSSVITLNTPSLSLLTGQTLAIGGNLNVPPNQPSGTYTGYIKIENTTLSLSYSIPVSLQIY